MKKIALIALLATTAFTPALAADLGRPVYKAAPMAVMAPVVNWNGFYVGGNIGGAFADGGGNAFIGGGQIGYNWQMSNNWVLGVEADIQGVGGNNSNLEYFGSVRGRLGYAYGNTLWYGTGGYAYGKLDNVFIGSNSINGYTAGGGVEWAFAPQWSAKIEYLYYNFENSLGANNDFHTVKLGVNYRFNWGGPVVASY